MRMSLMFGSVAGYVALWFGDGDDSCLAAQDPVLLVPLGMRGVLGAVVPASLALGAASLSRQLYRTVVHLPALVRATPTLHEAVLTNTAKAAAPILLKPRVLQLNRFAFVGARCTLPFDDSGGRVGRA